MSGKQPRGSGGPGAAFGLLLIPFILLVLLVVGIIRSQPPPSPARVRHLVDSAFALPQRGPQSPFPTQSPVTVYVDGSMSMRGFAANQGSEYCQFLVALQAFLSTQDSVSYYKFGETGATPAISQPVTIRTDPGFYGEAYTYLGQILENLARTYAYSLPKACLVLTDGIQSDPNSGDFTSVTAAVSRLLERGCYFEIFGIKSSFNGPAYSEQAGRSRSLGNYNSAIYGKRPFYCYVFSARPDFANTFARELQSTYGILVNRVNLTPGEFENAVVSCSVPRTKLDFRTTNLLTTWSRGRSGVNYLHWRGTPGESRGELDLLVSPCSKSDSIFGNFRFDHTLAEAGKCLRSAALDVRSKREMSLGLRLEECDTTNRANPQARRPTPGKGTEGQGRELVRFTLSLTDAQARKWCAARIAVYPGDALLPPQWIEDWSSDRDDGLAYLSRTLNLRQSIKALMGRTAFASAPIGVTYVAIRSR